ncbi:MAG: flippase [Bacteroidetes bacterium]|nr:flippase [Bacteroidota bacterium]
MAFILNVIAIVLAARFLGVENFGMFSSVLAIVGILSKFVDFGIEPIVFREFSKDKENFHLFSSALSLRFVLFLILVIIFNIVAPFLKYSSSEILLTNILFTTIVISMKTVNVRDLLATPFKVNLKMHYPMTLSILDNLILLIMVLYIPFTKDAVLYFVIAYSVSNLPGFVLSFHYLKKKFGYKFEATLHRAFWLLKESLPLFGFAILTTIFMQIDIVILNYYKGAFDVGIYSAGIRLTMPLNIIPGAIVTTVFPILVKRMTDQVGSDFLSNMVVKLLYFIAFVIAAVFTFESSSLVHLIFGSDYASTSLPSSILYWCQIFLFFTHYTLAVLVAKNKQFYNFICGAIQVIVNLSANFMLIPKYSFLGAALAKLFASFASFVFIIFALNKFGYRPSIGRYKVLGWSVLMCIGLYLLSFLPLIPYLVLSPFLIAFITLGIRLFGKEELVIFFKLLNKEELGNRLIEKYNLA